MGTAAAMIGSAVIGVGGNMIASNNQPKPSTGSQSTLTSEQQAAMKQLWQYLKGRVGTTATPYIGDRVAGMSDAELASQDWLNTYLGSNPDSALIASISDALKGTMKSPTEVGSNYEQYVLPSARKTLYQDILPTTKEAFAGPGGGYWGSARAEAETKATQDWSTDQQKQLNDLLLGSENASNNAAGIGLTLAQYLEGIPLEKAKAAQTVGALPRTLAQADLDAQYNEFLRMTPEASPWLDKMFQFLGLKTQENHVTPAEPSMLSQLLGAAGPVMTGISALRNSGTTTTTSTPVSTYNPAYEYIPNWNPSAY